MYPVPSPSVQLPGNSKHPSTQQRPFHKDDPRLAYTVPLDPRIHFALVCGAKVLHALVAREKGDVLFFGFVLVFSPIGFPE
jgi:hypothetical protein